MLHTKSKETLKNQERPFPSATLRWIHGVITVWGGVQRKRKMIYKLIIKKLYVSLSKCDGLSIWIQILPVGKFQPLSL